MGRQKRAAVQDEGGSGISQKGGARVLRLADIAKLGDPMTFGSLKIDDRFTIDRVEGSPTDSVSPLFTKTELARIDPKDSTSKIYNCTYFERIDGVEVKKYGWLHNLIAVTRSI